MTERIQTWDFNEHPEKGVCSPACALSCTKGTPEGSVIVCEHGRSPKERVAQRKMYSRAVSLGIRDAAVICKTLEMRGEERSGA